MSGRFLNREIVGPGQVPISGSALDATLMSSLTVTWGDLRTVGGIPLNTIRQQFNSRLAALGYQPQ